MIPQTRILDSALSSWNTPLEQRAERRPSLHEMRRYDFTNARTMFKESWEWLVKSVNLGQFPIPFTVALNFDVPTATLEIALLFKTRDVEEPLKPLTIKSAWRLSFDEAFSMSPSVAVNLLRREIHKAVEHELDEWLWVGGERKDPHEYENNPMGRR